jgi:hypothetical protein
VRNECLGLQLNIYRPLAVVEGGIELRDKKQEKILELLLELCVSSLRRGHANLLCIVPILTYARRRSSVQITDVGINHITHTNDPSSPHALSSKAA